MFRVGVPLGFGSVGLWLAVTWCSVCVVGEFCCHCVEC